MKKAFFTCLFLLVILTSSSFAGVMVRGLTHEKIAEPGEEYSGTIAMANSGEESEDVKVYQTDYLFYFDELDTSLEENQQICELPE